MTEFLRKNFQILIETSAVILLSMQSFFAMYLPLLLIPFFVWCCYSVFVAVFKPERRKSQLSKVAIWVLVLCIASVIQWNRSVVARQNADDVVLALEKYKTEHGDYPSGLDLVGKDAQSLQTKFMLRYWLNDGKPALLYSSTFNPFDKFSYDFQTKTWEFHPD